MTAEEILDEHEVFVAYGSQTRLNIIKAMEAYASMKVREVLIKYSFDRENETIKSKMPTEEEIDNHFNTSPDNHIHPDRYRAEGAKWFRNRMKGGEKPLVDGDYSFEVGV